MGGEWNSATVGDAFQLVNGFAFKSKDFLDSGVPVIKIKNVKAGYFSEHDFSYVDPEFVNSRKDKVANFDDLLISMSGNRHDGSPDTWVGKVALFRKADKYLINQRVGALRVKDKKSFNPRFMSYLLSSWTYQIMFISIATSSGGQANLSPAQILSAPIDYPDIDTQRHIAHILGTLDDKIELNRQMNATLEAMAQALFKSWFVDFDPVIDNALAAGNPIPEPLQARAEMRKALGEQRKPLPAEIQRQFPSRFVFTEEMGWVPEGWEVCSIGKVIELAYGKSLPTASRVEGEIPVYGSGGISGYHNLPLAKGPGIVVGRKGTIGSLYWVEDDFFPIDTVFFVNAIVNVPLFWLYQVLGQINFQQLGADSAVPGVNRNAVYSLPITLASQQVYDEYMSFIRSINSQLRQLNEQTKTLVGLRDTLLPKLLSGQLRISEAEAMIERAGVAV